MTFRADLHCHSCYSDGTDRPSTLIDLAVQAELSGLSITDHDTIAGYAEALPYAQSVGLRLLTGVEFSAAYNGDPIHVLGYGFRLDDAEISTLCRYHFERRKKRNMRILENLTHLGYPCRYDELEQMSHVNAQVNPCDPDRCGQILGRPHIALLLIQKGVVATMREAFDRLLGEGKPAFDPGEPVCVEETIRVIHAGGGKAILAHPHLIKRKSIVRHMLTLPFDGLEVYYADLPLQQEEKWLKIVQQRHWLLTGGSDYHGAVKPMNRLGSSWVDQEAFEALLR